MSRAAMHSSSARWAIAVTMVGVLLGAPVAAQNDDTEQADDNTEPTTEPTGEPTTEEPREEPKQEPEPDTNGEPDAAVGAATAGAAGVTTEQDVVAKEAKKGEEAGDDDYPRLKLGGYMRPGFGFRIRPDAVAKDRLDYGFFGIAGLSITADPFRMWRAKLTVQFDANGLENIVKNLSIFDFGDGVVVSSEVASFDGISIQEATAAFVPTEWFQIQAGVTRIPFSLQNQSQNVETMFPSRSAANEVFLSGPDIGALLKGDFADGIFITSLGVFNGASLGLGRPNLESRGVVLAYRGDINPFGRFDNIGEGDQKRGPFRLGAGFGTMFKPETLFDARTGTEPRTVYDLRLSASLRMSFRGLYFAAEYFRRQLVDNFSSRPEVADGAYGQLAFFFPTIPSFGIEPIVRLGFVALDQTFDPRLVGLIDAGINFYPVADADDPGAVKLTLQYLGERRFTEQEDAHGGAVAVQLRF